MAEKDTIYDNLGKFEVICGGWYIPWVNYSVANNGYSSPVGVVFLGEYLSHYFCISHLLSSVCRYILVLDDPEGFISYYPVSTLSTGMARDVTGVDHSSSRALVKYCWVAWHGMTRGGFFNCMARLTGGCAFFVWDLVRRAMGWSGEVSLGCTLGFGGSGKLCRMCTLGYGSHGAGSLGTFGVGWGGMGCCSLGCFSVLFWTLIYWRVAVFGMGSHQGMHNWHNLNVGL